MCIIAKDLIRSRVQQSDFQSGIEALYESERLTRDTLKIKPNI